MTQSHRSTNRIVSLLTYANRMGGTLSSVTHLLQQDFPEFTGVHLLPFYHPYDGADAGFDPIEHKCVDPRLGTWEDIRRLSAQVDVTADVIVNHLSYQAPEVRSWLHDPEHSPHAGLVLTFDAVFPHGASADEITAFYRPREGLPFTPYTCEGGKKILVWTTFMPEQLDIDVRSAAGQEYVRTILSTLSQAGVRTVRLDAIGYAIKTAGSPSFMTEETFEYIDELVEQCHSLGLEVLVEVHSHYETQLRVAQHADRTYDFALPPLLLHAIYTADLSPLTSWLHIRPQACLSVLDTHDGIGVIDASDSDESEPGLLTEKQAEEIFLEADRRTRGRSTRFSVLPQFARRPHQINATFMSVLGEDIESLVAARAIQLLLPGPAHVYYQGLMGLSDDVAQAELTGQGREINRSVLSYEQVRELASSTVCRAQRALVALKTQHCALDGDFSWNIDDSHKTLHLKWAATAGPAHVDLSVSFRDSRAFAQLILIDENGTQTRASGAQEIAALVPIR